MIKIKNYNKEKQKLSFVTDMSTSLANAIRRSVLEIPIMAIDEVEIIKNDSALYDEVIAHRIGLIPVKTDRTTKEIRFRLKEAGPKTIYSTDIKPSVGTDFKLLIVILDKEQEIEMICHAKLGQGTEHLKFSPGLIYYKHNLDENILDFITINEEGKISFDENELTNKGLPAEQINSIKKLKETAELEFNIESWGQIEARDIFLKAIDSLNDNLKELEKAVK